MVTNSEAIRWLEEEEKGKITHPGLSPRWLEKIGGAVEGGCSLGGKIILRYPNDNMAYSACDYATGQSWLNYLRDDWEFYEEPIKDDLAKRMVYHSFEMALKAKKVMIEPPNHDFPTRFDSMESGVWSFEALNAFDLADRKGWPMEVIE